MSVFEPFQQQSSPPSMNSPSHVVTAAAVPPSQPTMPMISITPPSFEEEANKTEEEGDQDQQSSLLPPSNRKRSISVSIPDLNLLSHQVAGQAPLFKLPDGKVLKPLVSTEYQFYNSLESHPEFLDFTPKYYGVIDLKSLDHDYLEQSCKNSSSSSIFDYDHWRNKLVKMPKENQNLYIKIEDLTFLCKHPCILDLKMGTRQHGVNSPIEKITKMEQKCRATTSSALGFRVCGLKVFDQNTSEYQAFDKYYGRQLRANDVPMVICKFLDNGVRLRTELLTAISKRLAQFVTLFEQQQCYKFYGGSLLFIYDGSSNNLQDAKLSIKMVDFAHASPTIHNGIHDKSTPTSPSLSTSTSSLSTSTSECSNTNNNNIDEGYLFGLKNLLKIVNSLIQLSNSSVNQNTI
ncbi:hypothetical protein SAMD00019534_000610 [Acytostelium subglobosum LB1]|uniref:hypothetical protein n=1 Tax=Acytostelium subglobosum LB1 TaxID=1410327 RepID=UPI0006447B7A|nr:hypothetical protein SAMD00019534_000610 [Acytostelium subglobosum LB1]GAM16886.1 hypothetical protein SAMD00019534_000610 [Acytostelium subglobosum LB1]|eukprot:XP_012758948.1 hypothetical protein SAMD00019534_000610 [Acytostelium subglobosum LB1]